MKGILFKPDMIQAIVEGRKTNTRRLDGLKEINQEPDSWQCHMLPIGVLARQKRTSYADAFYYVQYPNIKPRYKVGETVYIKEVWAVSLGHIIYKTGKSRRGDESNRHLIKAAEQKSEDWRSPLLMPEWAARRFITILAVRAERLQEITEEDCKAEGVGPSYTEPECITWYRPTFANLWDSLNPKYPFESNPWVFPYDFELERRRNRAG